MEGMGQHDSGGCFAESSRQVATFSYHDRKLSGPIDAMDIGKIDTADRHVSIIIDDRQANGAVAIRQVSIEPPLVNLRTDKVIVRPKVFDHPRVIAPLV